MSWRQLFAAQTSRIWVFCDGGLGALPETNLEAPQPPALRMGAGCGALVRRDDGAVVDWAWRALPMMTNNEAEYAGLLLGVELALRQRAQLTIFVLDSEVVVGQMTGRYAVQSAALRTWRRRVAKRLAALPAVEYRLAPRAWNSLADALARQAGLPWEAVRAYLEKRGL
ncbi:MAG: ribonuclease HI family protein [Caldilinea sp.]